MPDANVLFLDIENHLELVPGTIKDVRVVSKNGTAIRFSSDNIFTIVPESKEPEVLQVYSGKRQLLEKKYFVDTLSLQKIRLRNIKGDTSSVAEILANQGLRFDKGSQLYDFKVRIAYFKTLFLSPSLDTLQCLHE